jgi:hypothetical protein
MAGLNEQGAIKSQNAGDSFSSSYLCSISGFFDYEDEYDDEDDCCYPHPETRNP